MPTLPTEDIAAKRRRLAVECECPFGLPDGAGGAVEFAAYLADFGGPLGMVVDPTSPTGFAGGKARGGGREEGRPYFSTLSPGYPVEDEGEFLEALVDWGY